MLTHLTPPTLTEAVKSDRLDAPTGATILRIEPVLSDADYLRSLDIFVIVRVTWPDGSVSRCPVLFTTGGKSHPYSQRSFRRSLDGAKIEAQAFCLDGPATMGVRVTCGTAETIAPRMELPKTVSDELAKRGGK